MKYPEFEDRVLQILELFAITELMTSDDLIPVIKDVLNCDFPMTNP
jgi:hypothetical protein